MRYPGEGKDTTAGSCVHIAKWLPLCQFKIHRRRQQGIDVKQVSRTPMQVECPSSIIGKHPSFLINCADVGAKAQQRQRSLTDEEL